jgi:hypothetical protein
LPNYLIDVRLAITLNKGLAVKKIVLISIPILLVSCSDKPEVFDLVCKEDGRNREHNVRIDLLNSTMTNRDFTRSLEITENEMTSREIEEAIEEEGEQHLIQEIVLDRRTLVMTVTSTLETQGEYTDTISDKSFQCELLPERQL